MKWFMIAAVVSLLAFAVPALAGTIVSIYYDPVLVNFQSPASAVYSWVPTWLLAVKSGTFQNLVDGIYPGTTNIPINDDMYDTTEGTYDSSVKEYTGTGHSRAPIFDVDAGDDVMDSSEFGVRELFTNTFGSYGTYDEYGNQIAGGVHSDSAAWIPIEGIDNATLATGHVYDVYLWNWDEVADLRTYSYESATSVYVEYSTDGGATWSEPVPIALDTIPQPGTRWRLWLRADWLGER